MQTKIIITVIAIFLYGACNGIMDHLQFHYRKGDFANDQFWNPQESWKNKYKEGNPDLGKKFIGASTVFVFTTDAWHLFKTIRDSIFQILIIFLLIPKTKKLYVYPLAFIGLKLIQGGGFHLIYTIIF